MLAATALSVWPTATGAQDTPEPTPPATPEQLIVIAQTEGLVDEVVANFIATQIEQAEAADAVALIVQLDSAGATVSDERVAELVGLLAEADTAVGVWVGPSGATAAGSAAWLLAAADFTAVSVGSTVGQTGDRSAASPLASLTNQLSANQLQSGIAQQLSDGITAELAAEDAHERGIGHVAPSVAPTVGEFVLAMSDAGVIGKVWEEVERDDGLVQRTVAPDVALQFVGLSVAHGVFHTAASPAVAYLALLVGLAMILVDFFTGGIGVAAIVGAVSLLLSGYGLSSLGVRLWALAVLVAAFVAFAVDLQTGVPRFWTAIGCVALVVGTLWLFREHSLGIVPMLTGLALSGVFMLSGLPALIRTRYGTTTVGREWMVGELAVAATDVNPEGTVEAAGGTWPARVNRLTPIAAGDTVRVAGIDGITLQIEPTEGAAVDYREMRRSS